MQEPLKPYLDFVFKYIFGSENNKNNVLLNFINQAVRETEPKPFTHLTLVNPYIDKDALTDKQSILDVRAKNEDGKIVNVEIQVANKLDMVKRALYYSCKLYEGQLKEGDSYLNLKKTITINILNFNLLPDERFHQTFCFRENHTGRILKDDIEIHFIELSKLDQESHRMDDPLVRWLTFIKGAPRERWEELAMNTPGLKQAMTTLEFLSQNEEARALALAREKALRDEISALHQARVEGEEKGIEKGIEKGKLAVAKNLLNEGNMSISKIVKITGLSESEIQNLKKKLH